jgi:hypothetical protein
MIGPVKLTPAQGALLKRALRRHAALGDCTVSRDGLWLSFQDYEGAAAVLNTVGETLRDNSVGYRTFNKQRAALKLRVIRKINAAIHTAMAEQAETMAEVKASKGVR